MSSAAYEVMTEDLCALSDAQIAQALTRCRRELKYGRLTLADILERSGAMMPEAADDAAARAAWEAVMHFVRYHVARDPEGRYLVQERCQIVWNDDHTRIMRTQTTPAPVLDARTLDTVENVGGWAALKEMAPQNFPFVQKSFIEHFKAWAKVETVRRARRLDGDKPAQLPEGFQQLSERSKL